MKISRGSLTVSFPSHEFGTYLIVLRDLLDRKLPFAVVVDQLRYELGLHQQAIQSHISLRSAYLVRYTIAFHAAKHPRTIGHERPDADVKSVCRIHIRADPNETSARAERVVARLHDWEEAGSYRMVS